jgi:hypothetical protein
MFIVAQWLLPQQIRASESKARESWIPFAFLSFAASAALALLSPLIVEYILHWDHAPPMNMIFLSCLNISLLTWVFFEVQAACSRQRIAPPALAVLALGGEALIQLWIGLTPDLYLIAACIVQALIIALLRTVKL